MNKPQLIIAIPCYGRPDYARRILDNLNQQKNLNFTVVFLNDGADPKTEKVLNKKYKFTLHHFKSEKPSGLPGARNKILDYIEDKKLYGGKTYLAFIDDDLIVKSNFSEKIKYYQELYDGFCFRIIQRGPSSTLDLTSNKLGQFLFTPLIGTFSYTLGLIYGGYYIQTNKIHRVQHLNGGCLIYNLSRARKQRFDLRLNHGNFIMEDTDFSHRLWRRGYDLRYISSYSYIHAPATTGGVRIADNQKRFYWYWKHKFYLVGKFGHPLQLLSTYIFSLLEATIFSLLTQHYQFKNYFDALKK